MIAAVSCMYRAVLFAKPDKNLHRFVWHNNPNDQLRDYRMTHITFASSFIVNICIKQNAIELGSQYPRVAKQVETSLYADEYLGGADTPLEAMKLQGNPS